MPVYADFLYLFFCQLIQMVMIFVSDYALTLLQEDALKMAQAWCGFAGRWCMQVTGGLVMSRCCMWLF